MVVVVVYRLRRFIVRLARRRFLLLSLLFVMLWLLGALLFWAAEGPGVSFWMSLYWALITMATVGYGDVVPHTSEGRVVAGLTAIFGIATYTLLVSTLADYFMEATVRAAMGLGSLRGKRIIVIGEGPVCDEAVDELVSNGLGEEAGWLRETQPREEPPIDYIVGEIGEKSLRRAGVDRAKQVIICYEDDSKNIHASALVKKLNPQAQITTLVKDRAARDILAMLGVNHILPLSILGRLLVSSTFEPNVARFIVDAASARGETDLIELPGEGKNIEEMERKYNVRAVAVVDEKGRLRPARPGETLTPQDRIIALKRAQRERERT